MEGLVWRPRYRFRPKCRNFFLGNALGRPDYWGPTIIRSAGLGLPPSSPLGLKRSPIPFGSLTLGPTGCCQFGSEAAPASLTHPQAAWRRRTGWAFRPACRSPSPSPPRPWSQRCLEASSVHRRSIVKMIFLFDLRFAFRGVFLVCVPPHE